MSKFSDYIRYPWGWQKDRPPVSPMEGIYRKMFVYDDKVVRVFVIKGTKYSEVKFFINGEPRYVVSFNTFDDLVEELESVEDDFKKSFFSNVDDKKQKPSSDDKLTKLGYK